ncbi:hypothetical protein [Mucilaginibacter sp.]|uniref:hypothetical protein n=1 Tax=Mucilaginibacter sp. TaxID=1882438 RepID=UPI00283AEC99|nr:hypothetical protein [Mucilaginibacter sp.]MDR3696720.1 hypothetical protein [Mucilaginibacter sp.]
MITPQFTYDKSGNKVGVFLPIDDWDQLTKIPGVEELSQIDFLVPDWQEELGKKELKNIAEGNTELVEWSVAKKQFKL